MNGAQFQPHGSAAPVRGCYRGGFIGVFITLKQEKAESY